MRIKEIAFSLFAMMMATSALFVLNSCGGGDDDDDDTPSIFTPGNEDSGGGGSSGSGDSGSGGSGSGDSDSSSNEYDNYFTVDQGTYVVGKIPGSDSRNSLEKNSIIYYNERVLAGGMNYVTIGTTVEFTEFFIGIKGFKGYWRWKGSYSYRSGDYYYYIILMRFSIYFKEGFTLIFGGLDYHDTPFVPYEKPVRYEESKKGDLNINLTFNNAKDIDLHLYTPSNKHIYYAQRRWTSSSGTEFGLDHDSNRGCHIDNLNNENIWIPSDCVEDGEYRVVVDMYSNCDQSVATSWSLVAWYKNDIIHPTSGANPTAGIYPIGAGNNDMTTVMTFKVNTSTRASSKTVTLAPLPPTQEDVMKLTDYLEGCN
ncbi:MAG: hypothetical protein II949_11570 [Prevotella sp.]|nr:hypothetical protein [Prevotella sp.]